MLLIKGEKYGLIVFFLDDLMENYLYFTWIKMWLCIILRVGRDVFIHKFEPKELRSTSEGPAGNNQLISFKVDQQVAEHVAVKSLQDLKLSILFKPCIMR
jgi:hypothetical protein